MSYATDLLIFDIIYRIWSLEEKKQVNILPNVLPKSNDFVNSATLAGVAWQNDNKEGKTVLAVAYKSTVALIQNLGNSSEWPKVKELKTDKVLIKEDEYISVVCFSVADNGSYVAGGTTKGNIFIWHVNTGDLILETKSTSDKKAGNLLKTHF